GLHPEGVTEAAIARDQPGRRGRGRERAVIPGRIGLGIEVKAPRTIPGQRSAQAIAGAADRAVSEYRGHVAGNGAVSRRKPADEIARLAPKELSVGPGLQLPGGNIDIRVGGGEPGIQAGMAADNAAPETAIGATR